jgi:hypothetical protein
LALECWSAAAAATFHLVALLFGIHSLRKTSRECISGQIFAQIIKKITSDNTSKKIIPGSIPGDISVIATL